jgi:F-type H+-transporting ATPase subunit delta
MADLRAAKRYAMALFETAQKQSILQAVENDLDAVIQLLEETPAFRQMWNSPLIPSGRKRDLLAQLFADSIQNLTLSFLRLLVDKRREELLIPVRAEIHQMADSFSHLVRAEAVFAVPPTVAEQDELRASLEQRTGEKVEMTVTVDPEILGGVVVRLRDTIIDGSVRGTLERLREQLLQES